MRASGSCPLGTRGTNELWLLLPVPDLTRTGAALRRVKVRRTRPVSPPGVPPGGA
jgi:hypothetical protein